MIEKERARVLEQARAIELALNEASIAGVLENRDTLAQHRERVARFFRDHPEA